jgi:hypothetical protein
MSRSIPKSKPFANARALENERKYPHIIELRVPATGLDAALNQQIMIFHKLRHIQPRLGRTILKNNDSYYRWCFSDLPTARAFLGQFGGAFCS